MYRTAIVFTALITLSVNSVHAAEPSKDEVKKLATEMIQATIKGEFKKLLDATYPEAINILGGREAALKQIEETMEQLKKAGLKFEKYEVVSMGDFVKDDKTTYLVLNTESVIVVSGSKIHAKSYLLAISTDDAKTWTFLDGAGLSNKDRLNKVLPKRPASLKLPDDVPPKIEKQ